MANHEITNALISDKTARKLVKALEDVRVETPIADNLVTDSASVALSAGQGVVLKALVDAKVAKADVVNDLNQTTAGTVLDGRQGKVLGDAINAIIEIVQGTLPNSYEGIVTSSFDVNYRVIQITAVISAYAGQNRNVNFAQAGNTVYATEIPQVAQGEPCYIYAVKAS